MGDFVRERLGSEVVFSLLRVLATGYCLWGCRSSVCLAELAGALQANTSELAKAIASLQELDLVALDPSRHTIRLSEQGVERLRQRHGMVS
jgi:DNA-binding IclR family transcriptional regulator